MQLKYSDKKTNSWRGNSVPLYPADKDNCQVCKKKFHLCVFLESIMLCICLNSFDFYKSLNMVDPCGMFSFVLSIHARIYIRIEISISIRPITTKFGMHVHLEVSHLTQMRLIKQMPVTLSCQGHAVLEGVLTSFQEGL